MGVIQKARRLQFYANTEFAALYLKDRGYSIESALWILCRTTLRRPA